MARQQQPTSRFKPSRNAELVKYRDKANALSSRKASVADKLLRLVCMLLVQCLVKGVQTLSVPFGKLFAVYFWLGKSVVNLSLFLEKQLLKVVGWLSGTGFGRDSRLGRLSHHYWGVDIKRWHVGLVALVLGGLVHGVVRTVRNSFDERVKRAGLLRRLMAAASTYSEWRAHAAKLEQLEGEDMPGGLVEHEDYDRKLLLEKLRHLKRMRATNSAREQMLALRIDLIRNVANIAKSQAHRQNFVSVPQPIQQYIKEVQDQLERIANWSEAELPLEEKISFFRVTRHAYGRTALLLSGGGGLGIFHLGVCKALFERKMLPRVLAGSSVGSIVCAVVGTRTDQELERTFANLEKFDIGFFQNSTAMDLVRSAMNKGHLQDISVMICKLRQLLGDCTFLEAFERTGRMLNVTVCPADTNEPPRLLNYMTAPQALVWSAVAASSSFPGLYPPQHLLGRNSHGETIKLHGHGGSDVLQRRWRDGSLEFDLPVQTLAEMFNCNHFLVSQTNPHIVPLLNFKSIFPRKWASIMEAELKHRLQVVQWMLPEWKVSKWLTLFTQPWEGDITFTLPSMLWNLRKTIVNPSTLELMRATQIGEHATWERMAAIECNCQIEATLDRCAASLQSRMKGNHSLATMGGKVPSWLHLPVPTHNALPVNGRSWGDGIADNDSGVAVASWGDIPNMFNSASSHVQLPPLIQAPLYYSVQAGDARNGSTDQDTEARMPRPPGFAPLPAIPSSNSSDHDDGFDSASSVAAAQASFGASGVLQRALSHGGRRGDRDSSTAPGSAGISRRSSMMRNLHMMGLEGEEALVNGESGSKSSPLCSSSTTARGGVGSPLPGSNRSSISLPEVPQQPPQPQQPTSAPAPATDMPPRAPRRQNGTANGHHAPGFGAANDHHAPAFGAAPMSPPHGVTAETITEQQLLELANQPLHTDGMQDDIWGTLLPLAATSHQATSHAPPHAGGAGSGVGLGTLTEDGDAIDVFAY